MKEVKIDSAALRVSFGARKSQRLTAREFQLVSVLIEANHSAIPRGEIIARVWEGFDGPSRSFDVHMHNLRMKLKPAGMWIRFEKNEGYTLFLEHSKPRVGQ